MKQTIKNILIYLAIFVIAFIPHFTNMFNYPYYENDEGTYMSQAWSLVNEGKLAPYTYWYDHAPAGWILIGIWIKLTGGLFTFGTSVNSGRVFMLLIHILSSYLLFFIAKKVSRSNLAGILSVMFFSLSPLGIYFQRRVLLDNIMIFWVFVSTIFLLKSDGKISKLIISGLTFGIAVLTKENAIFFLPVFLFYIYTNSSKHQIEFLVGKWLIICVSVISIYFLYALLKKELFPVGFMGDNSQRVSLLTTLKNQYSRGIPLHFWDPNSYFYKNFIGWIKNDPFIMLGGLIATIVNLVLSIFNKKFRLVALMSLFFLAFLIRGKLVLDFYIIPLIPLFALNIGVLLALALIRASMNKKFLKFALVGLFVIFSVAIQYVSPLPVYAKNETQNQIKAIEWIKDNLDEKDTMIIDDSIYVDLHEPRYKDDKVFPNADWSWKVEEDPEIFNNKLSGSWLNIKYLILSHEILKQIHDSEFHFVKKALDNSSQIITWNEESSSYIDVSKYISTNGDWMAVYKIDDKNKLMLEKSFKNYKDKFIKSYGQVVDPSNNNTTSEGQSYALLRSVWVSDKVTFDNVWKWTQDHLQHRIQDKLLSWLWLNDDGNGKIGDSEAASDADEDIALALLFAYKKWGDEKYLEDAKVIIHDIWDNEVIEIKNRYYLVSGPGAKRDDGYLVNPSYLSPATYKIFAQIDPENDWVKLSVDSYYLLNKIASESETHLPSNWVLISMKSGDPISPEKYISDVSSRWYGFDAFRTMWRVSLDYKWFGSIDAKKYLEKVEPFFEKENDKLFAIYSLDGSPRVNYESLSTLTGSYFALSVVNPKLADLFYKEKIESKFNIDEGYYGDGKNYYDENWAWFASAYYYDYSNNLFTLSP